MPELPEVETIRRDLLEKILHKEVSNVEILREKTVRSDHNDFVNFLLQNSFSGIDRIGKLLIFKFKKPDLQMFAHLKMTGQFIYVENGNLFAGGHSDGPEVVRVPNSHTRAVISFSDGSTLYFNDLRVFGYLELADGEKQALVRSRYGIEPLTADFTLENFMKAVKGRKTSIKAVLLNQAIISGIGNIYADEACFEAKIKPSKPANKLNKSEIVRLHKAIEKVIKKAVEERGTTFNNYVDPYGRKGNFVNFLKVYGRGGEPCNRCKTKLKKVKVAGRGTVFCPKCQK